MDFDTLTAESILTNEIFEHVFSIDDPVEREDLVIKLTDKAKIFGVKIKFEKKHSAFKAREKSQIKKIINLDKERKLQEKKQQQLEKEQLKQKAIVEAQKRKEMRLIAMTRFDSEEYQDLLCGAWECDVSGIRMYGQYGEIIACYHPILPVERYVNMQNGEEKMKIAFFRDNKWKELVVAKDVLATPNKIVSLANNGVLVNSETARYLVKYLTEIEAINNIPITASTTKMGWMKKEFIPYCDNIQFDGIFQFKEVFNSISEKGSLKKWMDYVKKIRAGGRIEPKIMMAASFASVLMPAFGEVQQFVVDLYGETEGGKTLSMMAAASIWAYPDYRGPYVQNFKYTDTSMEVFCDFLNNLPLCVDDTAQVKEKYKGDMSKFVYDIVGGKGKTRSNKSLGVNSRTYWNNITMTTGEHSIIGETSQGGAVNRVISIRCGKTAVFDDGSEVASFFKKNYGTAGKAFIETIKRLGSEKIREVQQAIYKELLKDEKMKKQSNSMSAIIAADRIATDYFFKDGKYIPLDEARALLTDTEDVSEGERCYNYILSESAVNANRFKPTNDIGEIWGKRQNGYLVIIKSVFDKMCKDGGFSSGTFLEWAKDNQLLDFDEGRKVKKTRIGEITPWCVWLSETRNKANIEGEWVSATLDDEKIFN